MKTTLFRVGSRKSFRLLLVGSFSAFCLLGSALGAGGGAGAAGGGAAAGGAVGGGGHGGGSVGVSAGGHAGGGFAGGARGTSFSSLGYSGGRSGGLVPTGFTSPQGTGVGYANRSAGASRQFSSGYTNTLRSPYNNYRTAGLTSPGFASGAYAARSSAPTVRTSQFRNAWTEPNNPHVAPAARASRYGYNNAAYDQDRSVLQNRVGTGQYLYPGAAGYNALTGARNGALQNSQLGGYNRQFGNLYNRAFFNGIYYPYFFGGFFPEIYGAYGGFGDYAGYDSGYLNATANAPENADFGNTSDNAYQDNQGYNNHQAPPAQNDTPPTDDARLPANQPSNLGPQTPSASMQRESTETGPDTLVESVQGELSKRGYYGGKVDSMYNDATRVALKRFQADQQLPATGRINEATLHALQLD